MASCQVGSAGRGRPRAALLRLKQLNREENSEEQFVVWIKTDHKLISVFIPCHQTRKITQGFTGCACLLAVETQHRRGKVENSSKLLNVWPTKPPSLKKVKEGGKKNPKMLCLDTTLYYHRLTCWCRGTPVFTWLVQPDEHFPLN